MTSLVPSHSDKKRPHRACAAPSRVVRSESFDVSASSTGVVGVKNPNSARVGSLRPIDSSPQAKSTGFAWWGLVKGGGDGAALDQWQSGPSEITPTLGGKRKADPWLAPRPKSSGTPRPGRW